MRAQSFIVGLAKFLVERAVEEVWIVVDDEMVAVSGSLCEGLWLVVWGFWKGWKMLWRMVLALE